MRVLVVTGPAPLGGEVILIPPLKFGLRRQRRFAGFLVADQIAAHGDHGLATFRPKRRDDVCRSCAPIKSPDHRLLNLESIHQGNNVDGRADCWPLRRVSLERKRVEP